MDEEKLMRLLRPIYDAIDHRKYKSAIKLCNNKKICKIDIVQTLKAHCLERTGKVEEALELCREVQGKNPTDETTLSTLNLVFKLGGAVHEMTPSYEYAAAQKPRSEDIQIALFACYVRQFNFLKQQQTAMKMFKTFQNFKYLCWACVSMLLQVQLDGAPNKVLQLGEKMIQRVVHDGKGTTGGTNSEVLELLLSIMKAQGGKEIDMMKMHETYQKEVQDGGKNNSSSRDASIDASKPRITRSMEGEGIADEDIEIGPFTTIDSLSLEADLAMKSKDWTRATKVYEELVSKHNRDDWTFLTQYLRCMFERMNTHEELHERFEQVLVLVQSLESQDEGSAPQRGPYLAHVEAYRMMLVHLRGLKSTTDTDTSQSVKKYEQALYDTLIKYFDLFAVKTCCFTDVKRILCMFQSQSLSQCKQERASTTENYVLSTELCDRFMVEMNARFEAACFLSPELKPVVERVSEEDNIESQKTYLKDMQARMRRHLTYTKTLRFMGTHWSSLEDKKQLADRLSREYVETLWLNVAAEGGQREVQHGDDLALLSAHVLMDLFNETPSGKQRLQYLYDAVVLLEFAFRKSSSNAQMKILLSALMANFGNVVTSLDYFKKLDVKQIQCDSLSYLIAGSMTQFGLLPELSALHDDVKYMHECHTRDCPDYIMKSYRLGVFSKAIELTEFNKLRMERSQQLAFSDAELVNLGLLEHGLQSTLESLHVFLKSCKLRPECMDRAQNIQWSCNQDRQVRMHWDPPHQVSIQPADWINDSSTRTLVLLDKCHDADRSKEWLRLSHIVPQLFLCAVEKDQGNAFHSAFSSLEGTLSALDLLPPTSDPAPQTSDNVKTTFWMGYLALKSLGLLVFPLEGQEESGFLQARDELVMLCTLICSFKGKIVALLEENSTVSCSNGHLFSSLSHFCLNGGQWILLCLSVLSNTTAKMKRKKKFSKSEHFEQALSAVRTTAAEFLNLITDTTAAVSKRVDNAADIADLVDPTKSCVPVVHGNQLAADRAKVNDEWQTSQQTSFSRFQNLLDDKKVFLEALKL